MLDDIAAEIGSMQVSTRNPAPAEGSTVEVEGTDEEAMADEAKKALMRRLEALVP